MLDRADADAAFFDGRSARCIHHEIGQGFDRRLGLEIDPSEFDAVPRFGRVDGHSNMKPRVQAFSLKSDRSVQCLLFR